MSAPVTWVYEYNVFSGDDRRFVDAVNSAGCQIVRWDDAWWRNGGWPKNLLNPVIFRGCLGNASRVAHEISWQPGAFCRTEAFTCSAWYGLAAEWLLHKSWVAVTADMLVDNPEHVLSQIGSPSAFFVRPDSPLKPFSGRVLERESLSLSALDHGYYYDDASIPVIVAPVADVSQEWRYVVVKGNVVAGSAYEAAERSATPGDPSAEPRAFAQSIAHAMPAPEDVYVMDICRSNGGLRLLELNPFSGADLYACDLQQVVSAVDRVAQEMVG